MGANDLQNDVSHSLRAWCPSLRAEPKTPEGHNPIHEQKEKRTSASGTSNSPALTCLLAVHKSPRTCFLQKAPSIYGRCHTIWRGGRGASSLRCVRVSPLLLPPRLLELPALMELLLP